MKYEVITNEYGCSPAVNIVEAENLRINKEDTRCVEFYDGKGDSYSVFYGRICYKGSDA